MLTLLCPGVQLVLLKQADDVWLESEMYLSVFGAVTDQFVVYTVGQLERSRPCTRVTIISGLLQGVSQECMYPTLFTCWAFCTAPISYATGRIDHILSGCTGLDLG